jgi:hypothetical protein
MMKLSRKLHEITFAGAGRFFLSAFLFCVPFQIRTLIHGGTAFMTGNFCPYTTFFFYLTDLLLVTAIVLYGVALFVGEIRNPVNYGDEKVALMVVLLIAVAMAGIFLAPDRILAFFLVFRMILFGFLYLMIVNESVSRDEVLFWLIAGIIFQAIIAFAQYFLQKSVGLYFLGEPIISPDTLNVAKVDWNGIKVLRAYGTFSHANILGGAIFMAVVAGFYRFRNNLKFLLPVIAILTAALLLTFSRSAFFAVVAAFLIYIAVNENRTALKYIILGFSLLIFFIVAFNLEEIFFQRFLLGGDAEAGSMRLKYMDMSEHMIFDHPFGVGPGGFIPAMQNYSYIKLEPWVFQPAHNVFMMVANELGIIGFGIFTLLFGYIFFRLIKIVSVRLKEEEEKLFGYTLIALITGIMTISLFDHYFYTIYQGQALMFIFLALASSYIKNDAFPLKKS